MTLKPKNSYFFEQNWPAIHENLDSILNHKNLDTLALMCVYNSIYHACQGNQEKLYNNIKDTLEMHVKQLFQSVSLRFL
jgi:hypothetical protein